MNLNLIIQILTKAAVLLIAMPVHECAHAWAAHKLGDDTAYNMGRMTLNPVKHLSLMGSLAMLVIGVGWAKPVPINARNFKKPKLGMALSAFAGPVSNILLAFIFMIIYKIFFYLATDGHGFYLSEPMVYMVYIDFILTYIVILNISLGLFNLLPVPPLDGSRLATAFLPEKLYFKIMRYEQIIFLVLVVIMYTGILDPVLSKLMELTMTGMDYATIFVDLIMKAVVR